VNDSSRMGSRRSGAEPVRLPTALAAGCTVVLKSSETSPLSACLLAQAIEQGEDRHGPRQHDDDGQHPGKDRTLDKKWAMVFVFGLGGVSVSAGRDAQGMVAAGA
jgi:hypothetical protein